MAPCHPWVEIVKAALWPAIAFIIAVVYRQPLGQFFQTIGGRVTKLSVFKVEMELVAAAAPALEFGTIKRAVASADLADSSAMLFQQVQGTEPAEYVVIDIGGGNEWLTSRLFIGLVMLQRMKGLKCVVFTEPDPPRDKRLVAVAQVAQLRWSLAMFYPFLETAFARAYVEAQPSAQYPVMPEPNRIPAGYPFFIDNGGVPPQQAAGLTRRFVELLQLDPPPPGVGPILPPVTLQEWVELRAGVKEHAAWVTRQLLRDLLPESAFNAYITESREQPKAKRMLPVLEFADSEFVAVVDSERDFLRLIDRRAMLEELASQHAP